MVIGNPRGALSHGQEPLFEKLVVAQAKAAEHAICALSFETNKNVSIRRESRSQKGLLARALARQAVT